MCIRDSDMPRLEGEDVESYRTRLSMKGVISEWSGTKTGILYALAALGYEESTIEPFSYQDPERWAEFIVFLKGSKQSGINNLTVIDAEVRKVKELSLIHIFSTFANGIKSAFTGAVDAVKGGLQKIRNLLPFSDAKEGPLSTLTLSGQRTMTTYALSLIHI